MFVVLYAIGALIAFLLQTSPLLFTVGSGLRVDLALLVVVYFSLFWSSKQALLVGFVTGLCQDALSSETLGLNALSKSLSAFVVHTLCRNVQVHSVIVQGLFTCLAIVVDTLARLVVMEVFQLHSLALPVVFSTFAQQILLNVLFVPGVCRGLHLLARGLHVRQEKSQDNAVL
jgi:rod shape-determining protein MreD